MRLSLRFAEPTMRLPCNFFVHWQSKDTPKRITQSGRGGDNALRYNACNSATRPLVPPQVNTIPDSNLGGVTSDKPEQFCRSRG